MSLHGRVRGRPEGQAQRHARTGREARQRAPGANDREGGAPLTQPAAGGDARVGGSGTQSIAMGSNVQFNQTHSNPAGDDDEGQRFPVVP